MDLLVKTMQQVWQIFMNVSIPIEFQGITYNITFYALLIFTTVVSIVAVLIAKGLK